MPKWVTKMPKWATKMHKMAKYVQFLLPKQLAFFYKKPIPDYKIVH